MYFIANINNSELYLLIYKLSILFVGLIFGLCGYSLFVKGIFSQSGDLSITFNDNKILLRKGAPGIFFSLFGAIIICISVYKGFAIESNETNKQPPPPAIEKNTDQQPPLK